MSPLPSITSVTQLGPGHLHVTHHSHLPRCGSAPTLHNQRKDRQFHQSKTSLRTRTEWLSAKDVIVKGEIRNVKILGIIKGMLVVAYQGCGRVKLHVENEHSLELEEVGDRHCQPRYEKFIHGKDHRFAEFEAPRLPCSVLAIGCTDIRAEASPDNGAPTRRPPHEGRTKAKLSVSGHVVSSQAFASARGAPLRPSSSPAGAGLAASQRFFV
mmetsp:Transcript_144785/g.464033  ORF Transcript_144785/g.464033 Transcript_144785/m.464033 type:complete len:212 (-) Transcript_144785:23-658(-)